MKCTNNLKIVLLFPLLILILTGCGSKSFRIPYDPNTTTMAYALDSYCIEDVATPFAADLCVAPNDIALPKADLSLASSAGLFDITHHDTLYAKNVNRSLHPASLTKTMTAYLALKYGKLDDVLTASENVKITESGAQLCGFKEGDKLTLDQVLHGLLMYSGNDAGVMIAEYISGSSEEFAKLMNKEATMLGATNTNFVNPHGLTDDNHYTTAYDLYLIFQAAMQYDKFKEIIHTTDYTSTYTDAEGNTKEMHYITTNNYLSGGVNPPSNVSVIGGKTGTTKAAGNCLILLSNNAAGESFVSVVMNTDDKDALYGQMNNLLKMIP
ncbi:MAG: serine hydrolase [Lachnospiraceae bacterium]|nr:serine hydrolase [Lachnospiraceae bacterium]